AGKGPGKTAGDFLAAAERADEGVGELRVLVGAQLAFPGAVADGVGAGRPGIGAAAEKLAGAQDQNAAVAAPDPVEHMCVDRIKAVLHGPKDIARSLECRASQAACHV